jgi:hypothetical protein
MIPTRSAGCAAVVCQGNNRSGKLGKPKGKRNSLEPARE